VLQLGVVGRQQTEDPLGLAVTVDVQLQAGQHRAAGGDTGSREDTSPPPGPGPVLVVQDSRGAGPAPRGAAALAPAALPGSGAAGGGVEGGEAARVAAAHLAQQLQPLAGLHTVTCLQVQRLLPVEHLEHLDTSTARERGYRSDR